MTFSFVVRFKLVTVLFPGISTTGTCTFNTASVKKERWYYIRNGITLGKVSTHRTKVLSLNVPI